MGGGVVLNEPAEEHAGRERVGDAGDDQPGVERAVRRVDPVFRQGRFDRQLGGQRQTTLAEANGPDVPVEVLATAYRDDAREAALRPDRVCRLDIPEPVAAHRQHDARSEFKRPHEELVVVRERHPHPVARLELGGEAHLRLLRLQDAGIGGQNVVVARFEPELPYCLQ